MKFKEQLKRQKTFLSHSLTTVNNITHHPPKVILLVCLTTKEEQQKYQMSEGIKAEHKSLSGSCRITQEIWQRCQKVPKFYLVHISAEVLHILTKYYTDLFENVLAKYFLLENYDSLQLFIWQEFCWNFSQKIFFGSKMKFSSKPEYKTAASHCPESDCAWRYRKIRPEP